MGFNILPQGFKYHREIGEEMKAVALFSGGKDSTYALYIAMQQGFEIEKLITIFPREKESYMYHIPAVERTRYQAQAMDIPQDIYTIGDSPEELKNILANYDVDAVISGAIASNYQKTRIEEVCTSLGLLSYTPLWGKEQRILLEDMLLAGFRIMIIAVAAYGLDEPFLGKILDYALLSQLEEVERRYSINISGEGGEYETYVLDAPFFKKRIEIEDMELQWHGTRGQVLLKKMKAVEKRDRGEKV